jgi:mycofactocin precursor
VTERTSEPAAVIDAVPAVAAPDPEPAAARAESGPTTALIESELLVEDVSIDGMCGVY